MEDSKTDIKNRLLNYVGEGNSGTIWEDRNETCILSNVKQIISASLMNEAGHSKLVLWDNSEGLGEEGFGKAQDGGTHPVSPVADSCQHMAKTTHNILK